MISLVKGQNTQLDSGLSEVMVGLGWDPRVDDPSVPFDLDACAFMLNSSKKVRSDADFVFYNQKESTCGSVKHQGDNLTGEGDGDDEQILVDLSKVPADVERIEFTATIHKGDERRQNFGMVDNAFIRLVDLKTNEEIARFDLTEDACVDRSMLFGELYRRDGAWKFKAIGQRIAGDLGDVARGFGVNV
ncbi:MAG: TerD family protein [Thermoguttaceae bacterium]|nr:TerD family protein [Thermoguttaceae bacterium]